MVYRNQQSSYSVLILIAANALLFIAKLAREDLAFSLGLQPIGWPGSPWTIVTSMFIHADIWHITTNMITLYFFGTFLSAMVGEARFLLIYFLGGVAGGLVFILLAPSNSIAIGASGAVFAVGGAVAVIRPRLKVVVFPVPVPVDIWIALLGGLILVSFVPSVAWQAHLGGVVLGGVAGLFFRKQRRIIL